MERFKDSTYEILSDLERDAILNGEAQRSLVVCKLGEDKNLHWYLEGTGPDGLKPSSIVECAELIDGELD